MAVADEGLKAPWRLPARAAARKSAVRPFGRTKDALTYPIGASCFSENRVRFSGRCARENRYSVFWLNASW